MNADLEYAIELNGLDFFEFGKDMFFVELGGDVPPLLIDTNQADKRSLYIVGEASQMQQKVASADIANTLNIFLTFDLGVPAVWIFHNAEDENPKSFCFVASIPKKVLEDSAIATGDLLGRVVEGYKLTYDKLGVVHLHKE